MGNPFGDEPLTHNEFGDQAVGNNSDANGVQRSVPVHSGDGGNNSPDLSWGQVGIQALENTPSSFVKTGSAMLTPFMHPIDTAKAMYHTGVGAAQELDDAIGLNGNYTSSKTPDEQQFDALKGYFANRYGDMGKFKQSLATDPVGVSTDLAMALTGAGEAMKGPGIIGKIGSVAEKTGSVFNPLTAAPAVTNMVAPNFASKISNAVSKLPSPTSLLGSVAAKVAGDITTGAGSRSIKQAFQAGQQGGDTGATFLGNMRGSVPWSNVVSDAKGALSDMRDTRNAAYRSGMFDISRDKSVLDFQPIDNAMEKINNINSFKGKDLAPKTTDVRQDIFSTIADWKGEDPTVFHTPEGFDALKQKLGDIKDSQQYGTPQWSMANQAYNAVRKAIADQAPTYDKVMTDYGAASDHLSELQKELSLGNKGNPNTALRKLQSVMRDNANTSWGNRAGLVDTLNANNPNIMPALAGQALSTVIPRGLAKYGDIGMMGAAGLAHLPAALAVGAISSPRLMGELAYGTGAASRGLSPVLARLPSLSGATALAARGAPAAYEVAAPRQATLGELQPQGYGDMGAAGLWASPAFSGAP